MKKALALTLALLLCIPLTAACAQGEGMQATPMSIRIDSRIGKLYDSYKDYFMSCFMENDATVYSEPSRSSDVVGKVKKLRMVNYIRTENGRDGVNFYDCIEYYDKETETIERGYIIGDFAAYTDDAGAYMIAASQVYSEPSFRSKEIGKVGELEIVGLRDWGDDFAYVQFYSAAKADRMYGYVPIELVYSPELSK